MRKEIRGSFWLVILASLFVSCDSMVVGENGSEIDEPANSTISEPVIDRVELSQYGLIDATDINDHGSVVGGNFYWDRSENQLHHLNFTGKALNNSGQIVGDSDGKGYYWDLNSGESRISHPYSYFDVTDEWVVPLDINSEGRVVGEAWIVDKVELDEPGEFIYLETEEAFEWGFGDPDYASIEHYGRANGINDDRLIVGTHPMGAFKWDSTNYMRFLNSSDDRFDEAHAVNNHGQIVGTVIETGQTNSLSDLKQEIKQVQRILDANQKYDTIHTFELLKQSQTKFKGGEKTVFASLNTQKMYNESLLNVWDAEKQKNMIQNVLNSTKSSRAYIWNEGSEGQELGTLNGGNWSSAFDINDHGQVVGYSDIGNNEYRAFYWDKENGMIELPSNGKNSIARAINNNGQIVGENDGPVMWEVTLPNQDALTNNR